jgi:hypothetical protein
MRMSPPALFRWVSFALVLGTWGASCSTEVPLYAPEENILAIYGVLDPDADSQVIRISRVFQVPNGDAYAFAQDFDPSVAGLRVSLQGPNQERHEAIWRDSIMRDSGYGQFGPTLGYYLFQTDDGQRLISGERYRLDVRSPDGDSLYCYASTLIPPRPEVTLPRLLRQDGQVCLPTLPIEDSMRVFFRRNAGGLPYQAYGYQVRIRLGYYADGQFREASYGPVRLFSRSQGCSGITSEVLCYQFGEGSVLRFFETALASNSAGGYAYEREPRCVPAFTGGLPRSLQIEITAIDTAIGEYLTIFSPTFRNLNPIPPVYSNFEGDRRTIGVFGSVSKHLAPALLTPCAEYRLGFSNPPDDPCR